MEEKHFKELSKKLDTITKLLAAQATGNKKSHEAIALLSGLGFQPQDIAVLIGTTPNTVSVTLNKMKKKKVKKNVTKK